MLKNVLFTLLVTTAAVALTQSFVGVDIQDVRAARPVSAGS